MKQVKRVKFSFKSVNDGKCTVIESKDLEESSQRIKEEMKEVIRRYKKIP